jgi:hypothetical protein
VEPLVIVVKLDVFEELTPGPAAEDLILWKTLCFQLLKNASIIALS